MKDNNPTLMDSLIRPRCGWAVHFDDEIGYASFMQFGQNIDKLPKTILKDSIYTNAAETDACVVCRTNDGGMLWQYYTERPSLVSDIQIDGNDLIATSIYGSGSSNVGIFKIDSDRVWSQYTNIVSPGTVLSKFSDDVYAGTKAMTKPTTTFLDTTWFVARDTHSTGYRTLRSHLSILFALGSQAFSHPMSSSQLRQSRQFHRSHPL